MIRFVLLAALASGFAAGAVARTASDAPTVTWHPDQGPSGRYCIRAAHLETAAMTGTRIYRRTCLSERVWAMRGVGFSRARADAARRD